MWRGRKLPLQVLCGPFFSDLNWARKLLGRSLRMVFRDPARNDEGYIHRRRSPGPSDGTTWAALRSPRFPRAVTLRRGLQLMRVGGNDARERDRTRGNPAPAF
jgi:hypothetical protein